MTVHLPFEEMIIAQAQLRELNVDAGRVYTIIASFKVNVPTHRFRVIATWLNCEHTTP